MDILTAQPYSAILFLFAFLTGLGFWITILSSTPKERERMFVPAVVATIICFGVSAWSWIVVATLSPYDRKWWLTSMIVIAMMYSTPAVLFGISLGCLLKDRSQEKKRYRFPRYATYRR